MQAGVAVGVIAAVLLAALVAAYFACWRRRRGGKSGLNGAELGYPKDSQVQSLTVLNMPIHQRITGKQALST